MMIVEIESVRMIDRKPVVVKSDTLTFPTFVAVLDFLRADTGIRVNGFDLIVITNIEGDPDPAHPYQAGHSGMVCDAMVMRDGHGDSCGLPANNPVHYPQTVRPER